MSASGHAGRVAHYYDTQTEPFYRELWDREDLHLGLFLPGDARTALPAALKRMTRLITEPLGVNAGELVLDAGCGIGGAALDLARASGCRVLGLTISPRQVEIARERALEAGLNEVCEFRCHDCALSLPVENDSLAGLTSIEAVCHFEDRATFLRECFRALRPGALLSMSDWLAVSEKLETEPAEALNEMRDAWFLADFETSAQRVRALREAGFELLLEQDLTREVEPNARWMMRTAMEMYLGLLGSGISPEWRPRWRRQLFTLGRAFRVSAFTVGRFLARKPQ